ncbi:sodium/glutamate symporter [Texcoconibacillus texcoconensis]|uniref:ESS family glutamate:Na+ symporter n=1 Tax=Texcoconibacillus texcoconensis TaxID=1095777 RepID=A0A840QLX8_9BACI|nr:sodium/glutamate symporter [Texcoconibacillus texcoconensis]MBB5172377.1 ESS family glutamate:Na+ symporter [Texcoconibacillus texcoconensis]
MEISIWDLVIDLGLISILLLIGVVLRAKITVLQKLFLPASVIAGLLGLLFGPNGLGIMPFSNLISDYPTVLIAVVFGSIPIGAARVNWKKTFGRVRNMWIYSMLLTAIMWGGGVFFTFVLLNQVWDLPSGFGLMLGAGFLGGHGTAAAVGEIFANNGWEDGTMLGYTAATVGILSSVIVGLLIIKRSAKKKQTSFISDFDELPDELRTGLVKSGKRESSGEDTVSANTVDPLFFHFTILAAVVLASYWLQGWIGQFFDNVSIPLLSVAFIVGLLFQIGLRATHADEYVDKRVINRLSGSATDLIVIFGIASINLAIVADYAVPLIFLFIFGLFWAYGIFHFISPRVFHQNWFENGIFGWGWSTGTVAMGIALLRIVDPKLRSTTLNDYALGYIGMVPFEVLIITFGPILIVSGLDWLFFVILFSVAAVLLAVAQKSGWLVSGEQVKERRG